MPSLTSEIRRLVTGAARPPCRLRYIVSRQRCGSGCNGGSAGPPSRSAPEARSRTAGDRRGGQGPKLPLSRDMGLCRGGHSRRTPGSSSGGALAARAGGQCTARSANRGRSNHAGSGRHGIPISLDSLERATQSEPDKVPIHLEPWGLCHTDLQAGRRGWSDEAAATPPGPRQQDIGLAEELGAGVTNGSGGSSRNASNSWRSRPWHDACRPLVEASRHLGVSICSGCRWGRATARRWCAGADRPSKRSWPVTNGVHDATSTTRRWRSDSMGPGSSSR